MPGLNTQQAIFVKKLANGYQKKDAAILAGYSRQSADTLASQLIRNPKIQRALDKAGLTDESLARTIKQNIKAGSKVKATADTALRGIELVYRLKGALDRPEGPSSVTQNNIYVQELKTMNDNELNDKLDTLLQDVEALKKENLASK